MRLFKRSENRRRTRGQTLLRLEALEARLYLTCDLQLMGDGTLQILGDDRAQVVKVQDLGNGNVSVLCIERGDERGPARVFSGVAAIHADLKGGDDEFEFLSDQDVNAALPIVNVDLGGGNDRSLMEVTLRGTPDRSRGFAFVTMGGGGDDSMISRMSSLTTSSNPTEPRVHGEMHGGGGRDKMRLESSTSTGGFTLTSEELEPSAVPPTVTDPDCLIWDLVDGTSGEVDAQVMGSGSEVKKWIVLRSDPRGIGRQSFNFDLDAGGGLGNTVQAFLTVGNRASDEGRGQVTLHNAAEKRLEVAGAVDLLATSSSRPTVEWDDGLWYLNFASSRGTTSAALEIEGSNQRDKIDVRVAKNNLDELGIYIDAMEGDDIVVSRLENVVNHGSFEQIIRTGDGADTVRQSLNGFENYGTATFDTQLGEDCDIFEFIGPEVSGGGSGIFIAEGSRFVMRVDGGGGKDVITANIAATVDGSLRFEARGGRGADVIDVVVRRIDTNWRNDGSRESDPRPAIDILLEGNDGNDRLELDLGALDLIAHELTHALVDGGRGRDTACVHGPVRVVNVEDLCRW